MVVYAVDTPRGSTIHVATATAAVVSDRVLEAGDRQRLLLDAGHGLEVELYDDAITGRNTVATVDLSTGTIHALGSLNSKMRTDYQPGPIGGVLSPDGTEIAIGIDRDLVVVNLSSGVVRQVACLVGQFNCGVKWYFPLRWTPEGIIAKEVPHEGVPYDLVQIDPTSGVSSYLSGTGAMAVSPDGQVIAATSHINHDDSASGVRYTWGNTLTVTRRGGSQTQLFSERNHELMPFDVLNDGRLLFTADTLEGWELAGDMGLYMETAGVAQQQLPLGFHGEWGNGRLVDGSAALVARILGGGQSTETGVDLELVHLCSDAPGSCRVTAERVSSSAGSWPTTVGNMVVLPPSR